MTTEVYLQQPGYTVQGTGPYQIANAYAAGSITAKVVDANGVETALDPAADFTVVPAESLTGGGDLTLSAPIATMYDTYDLVIRRVTVEQQGFAAKTAREKGLEAQLDLMTRRIQELGRDFNAILSVLAAAEPAAAAAAASAIAAAQSEAAAIAAENSLLEWKGMWMMLTAYAPSDIVRDNGNSYICLIPHTSGTFATDLSAGLWELFVPKGAAGLGTGDMLAANNLSDVDDPDASRAAIGAQPVNAKLTSLSGLGLSAGDILYATGANTLVRLPKGAANRVLAMDDAGDFPVWAHAQIGVGQTWQDVSGARNEGTMYTNDTGRPLQISLRWRSNTSTPRDFQVTDNGGATWQTVATCNSTNNDRTTINPIIPPGHGYRVNGNLDTKEWRELR